MLHPLPELELREAVDIVRDWSPLRGARIFITGGTGFIGKWLIEVLGKAERTFDLGVEAVVLSRDPAAFLDTMPHLRELPWLTFQQGDITSFRVPDGAFSHLIHGAASSDARDYRNDPATMRETITTGARHTMEALSKQAGLRILFLSSGAVYGAQPPDLTHIPEDFPLALDTDDPSQAYAQGKREAERIITAASDAFGFEPTIARCFAFAGPHLPLDQHFAFGNFIRDALAGNPVQVQGDGSPFRSYLYASDLAAWLWILFIHGDSRTYHVGSDQDLTILELAHAIGEAAGVPVDLQSEPVPGRPSSRYVPAVTRISEAFGLRPSVDLPAAIRRTLQWHRG
ncbi:MAG TPA: NAD(P)-dependent oxidoreductase [Geothrix sp.]|jgi:dTDP-glucose 4,6-dehydratase